MDGDVGGEPLTKLVPLGSEGTPSEEQQGTAAPTQLVQSSQRPELAPLQPAQGGERPAAATPQPVRSGSRAAGATPAPRAGTPPPIPVAALAAGVLPTRLGRYELVERIGAGGMAEVYRAVMQGPEGFRRELVVKRILPQFTTRRGFRQMFVNEAKISALLAHPNIVQIFEFGEADGSYFIAMESVRGVTLREALVKLRKQDRVMPTLPAAEIIREVLLGLDYAHNLQGPDGQPLQIIHRDISPTNIMLAENGSVKILDFGIAHAVGFEDVDGHTVKGKVAYLAPEQIVLAPLDGRSDLFALGCVFYEMLTGGMAFRAKNDLARKRELLAIPTEPPSRANPDVPPGIDRIVLRALERDPAARYASAAEMLVDVENYLSTFRSGRSSVRGMLRSLSADGAPTSAEERSVDRSVGTGREETGSASIASRGTGWHRLTEGKLSKAEVAGLARATGERMAVSGARLAGLGAEERDRFTRAKRRRRVARAGFVAGALVAVIAGATGVRAWMAGRDERRAAVAGDELRPVRVTFDSSPTGARVFGPDGREVGTTPLTIPIPLSRVPGVFRFEKEGYRDALSTVLPDADKALKVELRPKQDRRDVKARKSGTAKSKRH